MALREPSDTNFQQVASDIFCEFLEVSIHQILHVRGLYPEGIFERKKKYGVPVSMCRHPELSKYISDAAQGIKQAILKSEVEKVAVVIFSPERKPLERFVFEVAPVNQSVKQSSSDRHFVELEESLRSFLLRINISDSMLAGLPEDSYFNILVYTKGGSGMATDESHFLQEFPWIVADDSLHKMDHPKLVPLKAMDSGNILKMQLYIEESNNKSDGVT